MLIFRFCLFFRNPPELPKLIVEKHSLVASVIIKMLDNNPVVRPSTHELLQMECLRSSPIIELLKLSISEKDKKIKDQEMEIKELHEKLKEKGKK